MELSPFDNIYCKHSINYHFEKASLIRTCTVNQLFVVAIYFHVFVFIDILTAIYFHGLQNLTMQEQCIVCLYGHFPTIYFS